MDIFAGRELEEVSRIFKEVRLPFPHKASFVRGSEGGLVFHTDAGVVIRAEMQDTKTLLTGMATSQYRAFSDKFRLNYDKVSAYIPTVLSRRLMHDHILQPVGSIATSDHIIEIAPGFFKSRRDGCGYVQNAQKSGQRRN